MKPTESAWPHRRWDFTVQLAIVEIPAEEESVTYVRLDGEEKLPEVMPLVFLNPRIDLGKDKVVGEEGCLTSTSPREGAPLDGCEGAASTKRSMAKPTPWRGTACWPVLCSMRSITCTAYFL